MVKFLSIILLSLISINSYATCSLNAPTLNFGVYQYPYQNNDVLSSNNLLLSCDNNSIGVSFNLKLGTGQSNDFNRYLSNNKENLYYNIYLDNSRSIVFGDGTLGTSSYSGTTSNNNNINVFAKIPKNQNIEPGNYQDNIIFEMTF